MYRQQDMALDDAIAFLRPTAGRYDAVQPSFCLASCRPISDEMS
jgi:hypothetical protein